MTWPLVFCLQSYKHDLLHVIERLTTTPNAPINVKPQGGEGGGTTHGSTYMEMSQLISEYLSSKSLVGQACFKMLYCSQPGTVRKELD